MRRALLSAFLALTSGTAGASHLCVVILTQPTGASAVREFREGLARCSAGDALLLQMRSGEPGTTGRLLFVAEACRLDRAVVTLPGSPDAVLCEFTGALRPQR